ncbi:mRNA-decapping enzyme 1B-like isoform X2 [Pomacea canaliculata]|uniref:mRNA-decapping enzyme 1B-like isoform X2 n=1 Tax=Pomacea canaliculata TaxID=400727 RepID=UPI000D73CCCE|nr:mRNA-decapping enzyme 1B-like isoform X2 [Pomacea canaliculata]
MADQNRINLATLQQRDPYITEILGTAKQVALYIYKDEWEKTSISGSLFVYKRSACPLHGVMILNKQGLNNQVEPITELMEFQITPPFLLYRNGKAIYGIWFYKAKECEELGGLMDRLRREAVREKQGGLAGVIASTASLAVSAGDQRQVDILKLLSGAQQRYDNKAKSGGTTEPQHMTGKAAVTSGDVVRPTPLKAPSEVGAGESSKGTSGHGEGPSQLQEIFKKAKRIQHSTSLLDEWTGDPPPDVTITPISMLSRSLSVSEVESGTQTIGGPPLKLPIRGRTVEEIEREIKSGKAHSQADLPKVQGQEGVVGMGQSPSTQELLSMIVAAVGDGQGPALPAMPQPTPSGDCRSHIIYAGDADLMKTLPSDLLKPEDFERQTAVSPLHLSSKTESQAAAGIGASCPDVLLTPLAFTSHPPPLGTTSPVPNHQAILERLNALTIPPNTALSEQIRVGELTPLTRQQLQQALLHMIRHDDNFLNRVHEAYLASFRQVTGKR